MTKKNKAGRSTNMSNYHTAKRQGQDLNSNLRQVLLENSQYQVFKSNPISKKSILQPLTYPLLFNLPFAQHCLLTLSSSLGQVLLISVEISGQPRISSQALLSQALQIHISNDSEIDLKSTLELSEEKVSMQHLFKT